MSAAWVTTVVLVCVGVVVLNVVRGGRNRGGWS